MTICTWDLSLFSLMFYFLHALNYTSYVALRMDVFSFLSLYLPVKLSHIGGSCCLSVLQQGVFFPAAKGDGHSLIFKLVLWTSHKVLVFFVHVQLGKIFAPGCFQLCSEGRRVLLPLEMSDLQLLLSFLQSNRELTNLLFFFVKSGQTGGSLSPPGWWLCLAESGGAQSPADLLCGVDGRPGFFPVSLRAPLSIFFFASFYHHS